MTSPPGSPSASRLVRPGWLDTRLVLGVLMVLVSVVVGARLLAGADRSQSVWVAARDLPAGARLAAGDVRPGEVRLFDNGERYLAAAGDPPVGYLLARGVGADELLARDSLVLPEDAREPLREVSVPVDARHLPADLTAGELVDVYFTPGEQQGADAPEPTAQDADRAESGGADDPRERTKRLLAGVPVGLRPRDPAAGAEGEAVVLRVSAEDALRLVTAVRTGSIDLSRIPVGAGAPTGPAAAAG